MSLWFSKFLFTSYVNWASIGSLKSCLTVAQLCTCVPAIPVLWEVVVHCGCTPASGTSLWLHSDQWDVTVAVLPLMGCHWGCTPTSGMSLWVHSDQWDVTVIALWPVGCHCDCTLTSGMSLWLHFDQWDVTVSALWPVGCHCKCTLTSGMSLWVHPDQWDVTVTPMVPRQKRPPTVCWQARGVSTLCPRSAWPPAAPHTSLPENRQPCIYWYSTSHIYWYSQSHIYWYSQLHVYWYSQTCTDTVLHTYINHNVHLSCTHQCPETHMIHINLNMILYTHAVHSPTKTISIKYYTKTNPQKCTMNTHTHTLIQYIARILIQYVTLIQSHIYWYSQMLYFSSWEQSCTKSCISHSENSQSHIQSSAAVILRQSIMHEHLCLLMCGSGRERRRCGAREKG